MGGPALAAALLAALLPLAMATGSPQLMADAAIEHCGAPACPHRGASASLGARLLGTGAHRVLEYRLAVHCPGEAPAASGDTSSGAAAASQPPRCAAAAALLQPLPPALFADVYQLGNAAAVGAGPAVRLFGLVDVESIEALAVPTVLAVYSGNATGPAAAAAAVEVRRVTAARPACC